MSNWYPAYSEYNNSDVAWIEKYPSHWECSKVKYYLEKLIAGGTPESGNADYWIDSGEGTPWVSIADITLNPDVSTTKKDVTDAGIKAKNLKILPKGTVLYSIFASLGKVGEAKVRLTTNQAILGLVPTKKLNKELFKYWLHSVEAHLGLLSSSNTQDNLNAEKVGNLPILLPPAEEQQTIAAFLDYETARIDRLIAKQQQLIELLKEKRQAVISHAVTKGLNPDAPMKDSGVEWLGQVPKHWDVTRLKYIGDAKNGLTYSPDDVVSEGDGILVLRSSNIQNAKLSFTDNVYVNMDIPERIKTKKNDLLICSRNGSRKLIGKNALITEEAIGMAFGAFMVLYRSNLNSYLYWMLNSPLFEYQSGSFLTSTINQLTIGNLGSMEIPLPPCEEREMIERSLKEKDSYFERLVQLSNRKVELLQERRSALISAAVTGKIDLRGWTQPAEEVAA